MPLIVDLREEIASGQSGWVLGLGKAKYQDPTMEIAFYNDVSGDANNPRHHHNLSTERIVVFSGGMNIEIEGEVIFVGPMQMICIEPGAEHHIVNYLPHTFGLNIRNSPQGAVGHLPEDR